MSIAEIGTEFKFVGAEKVGCFGLLPLNTWRDGDTIEVVAHVKMQGAVNPLYWNARDMSSSTVREDLLEIIPAAKPKPWSGPEDGLPPIGSKCRVVKIDGIDAPLDTECKIVANEMNGENMVAVYMHGKAYAMYVGIGISDCFSLTKSPDARETAIRELMDIAQVDCRVTAARLVDAGFKREVV